MKIKARKFEKKIKLKLYLGDCMTRFSLIIYKIAKDVEVKTYWYSYTSVFPCCCTLSNVEKGISFSWAMNLATFARINFAQHYINQKISNKLPNLSLVFISTALPLENYDNEKWKKKHVGKVFIVPKSFPSIIPCMSSLATSRG